MSQMAHHIRLSRKPNRMGSERRNSTAQYTVAVPKSKIVGGKETSPWCSVVATTNQRTTARNTDT